MRNNEFRERRNFHRLQNRIQNAERQKRYNYSLGAKSKKKLRDFLGLGKIVFVLTKKMHPEKFIKALQKASTFSTRTKFSS